MAVTLQHTSAAGHISSGVQDSHVHVRHCSPVRAACNVQATAGYWMWESMQHSELRNAVVHFMK